jgi:hypothetical protein
LRPCWDLIPKPSSLQLVFIPNTLPWLCQYHQYVLYMQLLQARREWSFHFPKFGYLAKTSEWNKSIEHWWYNNDRRKPKHPELNLYQFQFITNPTRNNMRSNLCFYGDRPISNYFSHGTTHLTKTYTVASSHTA